MGHDSKFDIYLNSLSPKPKKRISLSDPKIGYLRKTPYGPIWVVDWNYQSGDRHGSYELAKAGLVDRLINDSLAEFAISDATILDTETTGLAGGTGTYAFIIGAGFWCDDKFIVRQYLMRDFNEESAQLSAFAEDFTGSIVTYNGKCFDIPLLVNRYRIHRQSPPVENVPHLDMLFPSRRIWKRHLGAFKLAEIERQILGHARVDDVPSHLIPGIFFDYLQNRDESLLYPILNHNRDDILSLYQVASIAADLPARLKNTGSNDDDLLLSIAEICFIQRQYEMALEYLHMVNTNFASESAVRQTARLKAIIYKKLNRWHEALKAFDSDFAINPEIYSLVESAKLREHKMKDPQGALQDVKRAETLLELEAALDPKTERLAREFAHRKARLLAKIIRPK